MERDGWLECSASCAADIGGAGSLAALANFELDGLPLVEAAAPDFRVMNKEILAGFLLDEPKALITIKPFYFAAWHTNPLSFMCFLSVGATRPRNQGETVDTLGREYK